MSALSDRPQLYLRVDELSKEVETVQQDCKRRLENLSSDKRKKIEQYINKMGAAIQAVQKSMYDSDRPIEAIKRMTDRHIKELNATVEIQSHGDHSYKQKQRDTDEKFTRLRNRISQGDIGWSDPSDAKPRIAETLQVMHEAQIKERLYEDFFAARLFTLPSEVVSTVARAAGSAACNVHPSTKTICAKTHSALSSAIENVAQSIPKPIQKGIVEWTEHGEHVAVMYSTLYDIPPSMTLQFHKDVKTLGINVVTGGFFGSVVITSTKKAASTAISLTLDNIIENCQTNHNLGLVTPSIPLDLILDK